MMKEIATSAVMSPAGSETQIESFNPIYMMADSGARGSKDRCASSQGCAASWPSPRARSSRLRLRPNFREGLTVLQYFISTTAPVRVWPTRLSRPPLRYLNPAPRGRVPGFIISEPGLLHHGRNPGRSAAGSRRDHPAPERRILGRITRRTSSIRLPASDHSDRTEIDEARVLAIGRSGHRAGLDPLGAHLQEPSRRVRHVLRPRSGQGKLVESGGHRDHRRASPFASPEPSSHAYLPHRRHGEQEHRATSVSNRYAGTVKFINITTVHNRDGDLIAMNRNGEIAVVSEAGRERERYVIIYGAKLKVANGQQVDPGTLIADGTHSPPRYDGSGWCHQIRRHYRRQTMQEKLDPVTGKSSKVVVEFRESDVRPRISIKTKKARPPRSAKAGAATSCRWAHPHGHRGRRVSRATSGENSARDDKDQGHHRRSARVAELFEVRKPKENASFTEIDGV